MDTRKCPVCGTESLVTVVSKSHDGGLRQFCSECERRRVWQERRGVRQIAKGSARLLTIAGVLLTILTLAVDRLSISGGNAVFGWRQITGSEVGILCIAIGLLAGRGWIGMAGLFLLVLSLGADLLNVGHAPGMGWRNQTALAVGSLVIAVGMLWQLVLKRRGAAPPPDDSDAPH